MTDDLEHLETAFHEARELPPEERSAFLHRLRTEDPETAQEVEALLELDEEESGILERLQHRIFDVPSTGGDTPSVDPGDTTMVGRRVGAYRITGLLGRGGMGAVYRAEREQSPFEQTVALKLLAMGVDSPVARMRFDQERRILARLQHPGIASILDGGVADDGTPWFAMELVDGRSIDVHCDEERLSLGGRIRLFLEVCRAVEHAHGRLVLHRDLKPGNALVNAEGRVRLLDFGIGRVLEGPETSTQPALTQMGRAFTPGFASPEQLRGEAAEVSSDVYSLGVLLHLLLVGRSTESIGPDGEPLRPNEVLRKLDEETRQRIAAARRQTPEGLGRALDGDLRWILRRALAPDPGARYPVVQALRADLERYLDGRVVQAHPPSRWYSLRRWARRNRAAVAVAAALLVGSVGSVAGMVRAAAAEREAREEAALSAAVNEFLESLFRLAVSDPAAARSTSAAEVLQQGVSRADETLSDIPGLHARVLTALGVSYQGMGLTAEADSVLARAVEVADGADPPDAAARANARVRLAAHVLQTGQGARADSLSRQALAILRAAGEVKEWETWANAHAALGGAHQLSGRYDSARAEFEAARAVAVEATGGRYVRPRHLLGLGFLQYSLGELDDAEATYREALSFAEDSLPATVQQYGWALDGLATVLFRDTRSDRSEEAVALREEATRVLESRLGPYHPDMVGLLNNAGAAAHFIGEYERALASYERALEVMDSVDVSRAQWSRIVGNSGLSLRTLNRLGEARLRLEEALGVLSDPTPGEERALAVSHLVNLGLILRESNIFDQAEAALDSAQALARMEFAPTHPRSTPLHYQRALLYMNQGRWDDVSAAAELARASLGQADAGMTVAVDLAEVEGLLRSGAAVERARALLTSSEAAARSGPYEWNWLQLAALYQDVAGDPGEAQRIRNTMVALFEDPATVNHWLVRAERAAAADSVGAVLSHLLNAEAEGLSTLRFSRVPEISSLMGGRADYEALVARIRAKVLTGASSPTRP